MPIVYFDLKSTCTPGRSFRIRALSASVMGLNPRLICWSCFPGRMAWGKFLIPLSMRINSSRAGRENNSGETVDNALYCKKALFKWIILFTDSGRLAMKLCSTCSISSFWRFPISFGRAVSLLWSSSSFSRFIKLPKHSGRLCISFLAR